MAAAEKNAAQPPPTNGPVNGTGRPQPTVAELVRIRKARGPGQAQIEPELQAPPVQEPEVEPFPLDVLPGPARRLVEAASRSLGCPPDLVAVPLLVALGAAIGALRRIEVKPGWSESAALYAAVVARPGGAKSPAQALALAPLYAAQERFHEEYMALWRKERDAKQAREEGAPKETAAQEQKAPKKRTRKAR